MVDFINVVCQLFECLIVLLQLGLKILTGLLVLPTDALHDLGTEWLHIWISHMRNRCCNFGQFFFDAQDLFLDSRQLDLFFIGVWCVFFPLTDVEWYIVVWLLKPVHLGIVIDLVDEAAVTHIDVFKLLTELLLNEFQSALANHCLFTQLQHVPV